MCGDQSHYILEGIICFEFLRNSVFLSVSSIQRHEIDALVLHSLRAEQFPGSLVS